MSGTASAPACQVQREVGKRVCGELIDYRVGGGGGWALYRVAAQWRRNAYTWWHAMEVETGARVRLAIDVRNEGGGGGKLNRCCPTCSSRSHRVRCIHRC